MRAGGSEGRMTRKPGGLKLRWPRKSNRQSFILPITPLKVRQQPSDHLTICTSDLLAFRLRQASHRSQILLSISGSTELN